MDKIWSENKYVNLLISILVFLVGINFLHYGQLFLPIICFVLFVDNKLQFRVNDPRIFVLLCLFGIGFYAFSYQLGFYSVMGFTLPMAYYIGSNIKSKEEEQIKKVIFLLAIAMAMHVVLNSIYEYIVHGTHGFFFSSSHYDIWMREKIMNTAIALDADLLIACFYYIFFHEKNRKVKMSGLMIFAEAMFYLVVIGRRTQVLMLMIVVAVSFFFEAMILKTIEEKQRKKLTQIIIILLSIAAVFSLAYVFDLFDFRTFFDNLKIIQKLKRGLISDERVSVLFDSIKLMPEYLFGGQKISGVLSMEIHNFWFDIYDYAGIIPFVLICIYSAYYLHVFIRIVRSKTISDSFKTLTVGLFVCTFVQFNLEPLMTGGSILVIVSVMIGALLEGLIHE